jgi:hypothetical protein
VNTNLIKHSKTKSIPNFPELPVGKTKRVFTKHFCNLPLWCSADEVAVLNWLVYRSGGDNTFEYSTRLLDSYSKTLKAANKEYELGYGWMLGSNISELRRVVLQLIEKGLIFNTGNNVLMINPMLTYSADIVSNKEYERLQKYYQGNEPAEIAKYFTGIVAKFLESKKKNYKYHASK